MLVGQSGHHWRDVAVDVVQVHHIGLEFTEQALERCRDIAPAHHSLEASDAAAVKVDLGGKVLAPRARIVEGIVHRKDRYFVPVLAQHRLGALGHNTVATPTVVKFIDLKYAHVSFL